VFLQNVTWLVEQNRERLKALGVVPRIMRALGRHCHNVEVARYGAA
jgi:hypothetical protein